MSERKLTVTISGPRAKMLAGIVGLLRDAGYTVVDPDVESELARLDPCDRHSAAGAAIRSQRDRVEVLEGLMRETIQLWHEWSTTDITADEDRWVSFTDRAHAWLAKARIAVPDRTPKEAPPRRKVRRSRNASLDASLNSSGALAAVDERARRRAKGPR